MDNKAEKRKHVEPHLFMFIFQRESLNVIRIMWLMSSSSGLAASRRTVVAGLCAVSAGIASIAAASEKAGRIPGVYLGAGRDGRGRLPDYERWLGRPASGVVDFISYLSWNDVLNSTHWTANSWAGYEGRLTLTIPMLPKSSDAGIAQGAAGAYDTIFKQLADIIAASRKTATIIRIGHEFNGNWYPWSVGRDAGAWKEYWRRIAQIFKGHISKNFLVEWSPIANKGSINVEDCWPGGDLVDVIGLSFYNDCTNHCVEDAKTRWREHVEGDWGVAWHRAFAKAQEKPRSFPEWGTGFRSNGMGGRDDPYFIEGMSQVLNEPSVFYHNYFDFDARDFHAKLSNNQFPMAALRFKQLFGSPRES